MRVEAVASMLAPAPAEGVGKEGAAAPRSFGDVLAEKLAEVDALQKRATEMLEGFLAGEVTDVHEVILAAQQAELALQLTVEIRNRVIEAYQEVARMQL
ncbi:MAG: flagellar hook-basal body complex protein FliE [Clostridia bacterium]|jgi:flagellar hook-basal body complex protein FliE|nr:flagellar hook-basal body complex protein FliE [Clostridia bacterium]MDH7573450.1 flagellar hook-basal body complex protein FliE [Clostridia bacterium]